MADSETGNGQRLRSEVGPRWRRLGAAASAAMGLVVAARITWALTCGQSPNCGLVAEENVIRLRTAELNDVTGARFRTVNRGRTMVTVAKVDAPAGWRCVGHLGVPVEPGATLDIVISPDGSQQEGAARVPVHLWLDGCQRPVTLWVEGYLIPGFPRQFDVGEVGAGERVRFDVDLGRISASRVPYVRVVGGPGVTGGVALSGDRVSLSVALRAPSRLGAFTRRLALLTSPAEPERKEVIFTGRAVPNKQSLGPPPQPQS